MSKEETKRLIDRATSISGQGNLDVIEQGVRLLLAWYGDNPDWPGRLEVKIGSEDNGAISPAAILLCARGLVSQGTFTLDDLLDSIYGPDIFVWEAKAVKNRIATVLRAAGYLCKQKRRSGKRVLAWGLPIELQQQSLISRVVF